MKISTSIGDLKQVINPIITSKLYIIIFCSISYLEKNCDFKNKKLSNNWSHDDLRNFYSNKIDENFKIKEVDEEKCIHLLLKYEVLK